MNIPIGKDYLKEKFIETSAGRTFKGILSAGVFVNGNICRRKIIEKIILAKEKFSWTRSSLKYVMICLERNAINEKH